MFKKRIFLLQNDTFVPQKLIHFVVTVLRAATIKIMAPLFSLNMLSLNSKVFVDMVNTLNDGEFARL
jgi:hypothetical protein